MPYYGLQDGLYLVRQFSPRKGLDHYAILDVGNWLATPIAREPVVVHQSPPAIRADWLSGTGAWIVVEKIEDEQGAIGRINEALRDPRYSVLGHNCEHFARYVATGKRESPQLKGVIAIAGFVGLVILAGKTAA